VPNALGLGQEHARNLETALQAQFALCTTQPACAQRFGDSYKQLLKLRDRLRATPVTTRVADPNNYQNSERTLTATRLAGLVRLYAYNSATSALLPLMIDEASKGNYAPLLGQAQLISDDVNNNMADGVGMSIGCSEDVDLLTIDAADRDTLLGHSLIEYFRAACEVWPHRPRPADFHEPLATSIPTLILAGEFDPVTPPRYAQEIARSLSNARVLLAPGQGHAVLSVRCMPKLLEEFVTTLQPGALDATCLEQLKPMPAFLDYNGAAP
jgi:pimeloyl-ACP methyl ester carboxylesterase